MSRRLLFPFCTLLPAILLAIASTHAAASPATRLATQPSTRPAPAVRPPRPEAHEREKKLTALTRQAIDLMTKQKLDDAERVLNEALLLEPANLTNLYNYACLLALRGNGEKAVSYLEKAAEAGWADFIQIERDPDLASLKSMASFQSLIKKRAEYQKRSAMRVVEMLKKQFGEGYLYELDHDRKLIFATNTDKPTLDALKQWLTAQANSQWAQLFKHKPDQYISVVLPSPADYRKIVRIPGVGGFYNNDAKLLICQRLGQTVTHEFTHALHAADTAPLGQDHPIWIAEGLASLFEPGQFDGDKLVPQDNFRLNMLQNAYKGKKLIPLAHLVKMQQPEFVKRANIAYGQASSVMLYLYERQLLRPFYETYKQTYTKDASGVLALEQVTKQSLADFDKAWSAWMAARPPVPGSTGPEGVVIGAKLADGIDGIKVETLIPAGPAEKAGLHRGDVLVGIEDAQVRDYLSFVSMLIQFKPGDHVTLKIRRDGRYIDLPLTFGRRSEVVDRLVKHPASRPTR